MQTVLAIGAMLSKVSYAEEVDEMQRLKKEMRWTKTLKRIAERGVVLTRMACQRYRVERCRDARGRGDGNVEPQGIVEGDDVCDESGVNVCIC